MGMTMHVRRWACVLLLLAIAGCNSQKTRNLIDERADQTKMGLDEARAPAPPKKYNPLTVSEKIWAGSSAVRMRRGTPLPARFEAAHGIALVSTDALSLTDIAGIITTQTGIPVRIAPGTAVAGGGGMTPTPDDGMGGSASSGPGYSPNMMPLNYDGPLSGLLDQACAYFGISWKFDGASINISRFETRVFAIEALPGTQSVKDGMKEDEGSSGSSGGSSGSSSGGGSSSTSSLEQSSKMEADFKVWDEISQTVSAMLAGTGTVVVAPSSGTMTVTTTPEIMRAVAKFVEQENLRLSRQIAINVEIYKVDLTDGSDFNFSLDSALKKLGQDVSVDLTGPSSVVSVPGAPLATSTTSSSNSTAAGSISVAILSQAEGQITGLFKALSALGDASRVAQFPMTTLNNRPVSRRIGRDIAYVASSERTDSTSGSTTATITITPGTIREGFSLQLTPRLLDDGRIMLQYSLSLTDFIKITTVGDINGGNYAQLPETTSRVFVQQSMLKSGSTLVLSGVDDEQAAQNAQGVGSPFNFIFGGGTSNATSRSMLFIAITPQVLDVPRAEQG